MQLHNPYIYALYILTVPLFIYICTVPGMLFQKSLVSLQNAVSFKCLQNAVSQMFLSCLQNAGRHYSWTVCRMQELPCFSKTDVLEMFINARSQVFLDSLPNAGMFQ